VLSDQPVSRSGDGCQWHYINEKVHCSVIEQRGKIGVVDETRFGTNAPKKPA
jgi:hypothetical protein